MYKRLLLVFLLFALIFASSGCSNRLAEENDKLRKQVLDLQRETVAMKTDKKILEEKINKLISLVPPELLPVEELVTKLPAERRLGKIPARSDIIRYMEQNIISLARGELAAGAPPWHITKFTFIPPDLVYVDYESNSQKEKILLMYSLLEEMGIKTELKAYFRLGNNKNMELVRGEDVDHIATPLVYAFSEEKGVWEEITRIGSVGKAQAPLSTPLAQHLASTNSPKIPDTESKTIINQPETDTTDPSSISKVTIAATPEINQEISSDMPTTDPDPIGTENIKDAEGLVPVPTPINELAKMSTYKNKWHNYTIDYPSHWYFWGMGQTEDAIFRTAFAKTEVTITNALITVDIIAETASAMKAMYPAATVSEYNIAGSDGWRLVLPNDTELYLRNLEENKCVVFTAVASQANVLSAMIDTFRLND